MQSLLAIIVCLVFAAAQSLLAQGTDLGVIRGTITDATGAVVADAPVEIFDVSTGTVRQVRTNSLGAYEASGLRSGEYRVAVNQPGFTKLEVKGILLRGGDVARADGQLQVSTASQSVLVESNAPVIQTENPTISYALDNKTLIEIPRDSRDIYQFLYLNPNVTQSSDGGGFKFLGAQSYGAAFTLDGQRSNGGIFGSPTNSQPSLEVIGELNILTNNFSAEYAGIANVRVQTKRGGSDYHGSVFYNNRNSALSAWSLRDKNELATFIPSPGRPDFKKPYTNLNEFGGSFGGPLKITKKTYFMSAYERQLTASPINMSSTTLPHPSLWIGDFTRVNDSVKPQVPAGIQLTEAEIANNTLNGLGKQFTQIPARLLNPSAQSLIQKYFPSVSTASAINPSNGRLSRYYQNFPAHSHRDLGTLRLDHDFSDNDRFYAVLNIQDGAANPFAVQSPFPGLGLSQQDRRNYTFSASYTKVVTPGLVNEARGGFNTQNFLTRSNNTLREFLSSIGFNEADIAAYGSTVGPSALDTFGHSQITWGNFAIFNRGGRNTYRPQDQKLITFGDTLSWIKGAHSMRFGADFVRNAAIDGFANNRGIPRGAVTYSGAPVDAFARFLLGQPANTAQFVSALRPPMDVYNWESGFFAQDDWKISPKLTINLGLRYEILTPFVETNNLMVNFNPDIAGVNGNQGKFILPSQDMVKAVDPRILSYGYALASDVGVGRGLVHTDRNNFAPRVGVAYRLSDRNVIRGGFGIYYTTSAAQGMRDAMATNPFNQTVTKTNTADAALAGWPGFTHGFSPLNGGALRATGNLPAFNMIPFDIQTPYIMQYNLTYERELPGSFAARASYIGTRMRDQIAGIDRNLIPPSDRPFGTTTGDGVTACDPDEGDCDLSPSDLSRLPFPLLGDYMASYGNVGGGRSHALQLELNRRYQSGLTFNAVYTFLDQQTQVLDGGNSSLGGPTYNQFDPSTDFGRDSFVSRHRFVAYGVWETPFGRGRKFGHDTSRLVDAIAGGWQLSGNFFAKSGTGFTPFWTCDNCGPAYPGNIASGFIDAYGQFDTSFRPLVTGDVNAVSGDRHWNPTAFAPPPVGADLFTNPATVRRNALLGPGTYGLNLGLRKVFSIGERVRAELGADFNNVLNHPMFSPPNNEIARLGSFAIDIDPNTRRVLPITRFERNPDFGRLIQSFSQDGIDLKRMTRLRLRITF